MKRNWIPILAIVLTSGAIAARADDLRLPLPAGAQLPRNTIIVQAPEPIAAPVAPPAAATGPAPMVAAPCTGGMCGVDCCEDECPKRARRERFNLCDYWQILKACFYCQ